MLCQKPFMVGVLPCGCGRCMPCRINRRRLWSTRLLLESVSHASSSFVTLTYQPDAVPKDGSLRPDHVQAWLKRLRKIISPQKIRYFVSGEYGDHSERPHYHAILFGYNGCLQGRTDHTVKRCCTQCELIRTTWKLGGVDLGDVNEDTCSYVAGYVTKKMMSKDDPRLKGRHPEFARMSLRPGIGAAAISDVARALDNVHGRDEIARNFDVPATLKVGQKTLPIGRYLRRLLRIKTGLGNGDTPKAASRLQALQLRVLYEDRLKAKAYTSKSLGLVHVEDNAQKVLNLLAKVKINTPRRHL